ncbi:MAG: RpoL/Rpb11 RNA polymerase subunit family protein [Candidatus Aenigmarchaeota archaeon]|nr:DNA-directed RNA polymerase subunit L [Candidatus Aenigmarchaeota archaeon]MDW8149117.1 RpoL/Rpb11 RNA polymerase subunit family protein [Candidatus Aenigmarchaeota archaeon]
MEVKISEEKNGYIIEFMEISKTFVYLLNDELKKLKNVEEAVIMKVHPYYENPKIWLKLNNGKPKEILKEAIDNLIEKFEKIEKLFESSK